MRLLITLLAAALCLTARAEVGSHRRAASEVLDMLNGPAALRVGVSNGLMTMLDDLQRNGAPEPAVREFKHAVEQWISEELIWEEIKPQMVDLYVREFSEEELRQLLAFYRSPLGAKALRRFPAILSDGARIGQAYALSKQGELNERLERIADKYNAMAKPSTAASALKQ